MQNIPLALPDLREEEKQAVLEVLESGWLAHGPYNKKLEKGFCELVGVPHAISMNSATSALETALKINGIKGEVILPSFTFVASANSIVTSGATPVFADVNFETRNIRAAEIEPLITDKTEAVMIVHFGGQPCEMDEIIALCNKHNLLLIEDSAETLGATWKGQQAGSFGLGCFSFFPTKNMTTGEGGMLTLKDDDMNAKARQLIGHGIGSTTLHRETTPNPWERSAVIPGHNYRMSNVLAAIGTFQLKRIESMNMSRIKFAKAYDEQLNDLKLELKTPVVAEGSSHVYQMYTITVPKERRDALVMGLREQGIGASVHFDPAVHEQDCYFEKYKIPESGLPNTELLSKSIITLPMYPTMPENAPSLVCEALKTIW